MNTPRYMLDTNVVSDVIRNPHGAAAAMVERAGDEQISISAIVASELRFGVLKRNSERLTLLVEAILDRISILPYEDKEALHFAQIRHDLERSGQPIGTTDLFIAAHARSLDVTLVTANIREFARVPGLKVENWVTASP
ncbi:MAG: type II toxin-antitoxin system VapC family toxin [Rhizobium rhizophilum]|uniref:type II toxin-antitoxin system VapC family toxin n=1 Tax=Rhizobium rhizophilum TaxID=1850373 RepID=UPI00391C53DC